MLKVFDLGARYLIIAGTEEDEMYHSPLFRCLTDVYLIQSIGSVAKM